ncbi:4-hydroxy-tetrahydrodipicolinate synthase [Aurantivibrio infirmus]
MYSGSYTALLTPFKNGDLDEQALRKMVNWQIENGTQGLVPAGTTGESPTLNSSEHKRTVEIVVEESKGRVPVIAGAGSNNPVEALEYVNFAEGVGADAVLCVAGYYNRPSQQGLYEHFKMIHNSSSIPIIIYNVSPRTIVDINPDTMAELSKLPRILGVKDASADLSKISLERQKIIKQFSFFSGEDITALAYNAMGGTGCISVTANIAPRHCAVFQNACAKGNYKLALEFHEKLVPLHQALFLEPSPAGVKYAASLLGLCTEDVRCPILPLQDKTKKHIKLLMSELNLIS